MTAPLPPEQCLKEPQLPSPAMCFKELLEKQISYAAALRSAIAGEDDASSEAARQHLSALYTDRGNSLSQEPDVCDTDRYREKAGQLKYQMVALREKLCDLRLQQQRLEDLQRRRYPNFYNAPLESLDTCLKSIAAATETAKEALASDIPNNSTGASAPLITPRTHKLPATPRFFEVSGGATPR